MESALQFPDEIEVTAAGGGPYADYFGIQIPDVNDPDDDQYFLNVTLGGGAFAKTFELKNCIYFKEGPYYGIRFNVVDDEDDGVNILSFTFLAPDRVKVKSNEVNGVYPINSEYPINADVLNTIVTFIQEHLPAPGPSNHRRGRKSRRRGRKSRRGGGNSKRKTRRHRKN